jgi:hypothetical protein
MSDCTECGMPFTPRKFPAMRTLNLKYCIYCGEIQDWKLDEGQSPIGYSIDPDLSEIMNDLGNDIGESFD